jgi:MHS family shikimate/dehydroshikimate transporter-like MFS transporter
MRVKKLRISHPTVASTVGTSLEWYDFSLYSTASVLVFPTVFFSSQDPLLATLASFGTFAVGFFARPVGGVVIGMMGDRFGRRQMLFLTLLLMGVASTLIGLLPSFDSIGIWAPILLVVLRIMQGLGAGGEYAGATLMAAEHSSSRSRGLNASLPGAGNAVGALLATGVFMVISAITTREELLTWAWRIPFLLSCVLTIVAVLIRLKVEETPEFEASKRTATPKRATLSELFRSAGSKVPFAMLASIGPNVASYLPSVYALSYLTTVVGAPAWIGLTGVLVGNGFKLVTIPVAGRLSDIYGRRPVFLAGAFGAAVLIYPFFFVLDTGSPILIWMAFVLLFSVCNALMLSSQSAFMSELYDVRLRYTGVTFSREITGALIGGTLPFIAAALTSRAGGAPTLVSVYLIVLCLLAAFGMYRLPETRPIETGVDSDAVMRPVH